MHHDNMLGKDFDTLGQRIVYPLYALYPDFALQQGSDISDLSQQDAHRFLASVLTWIYQDPSHIGIAAQPDESYPPFTLKNSNPSLTKKVSLITNKLTTFLDFLRLFFASGQIDRDTMIMSDSVIRLTKHRREQLRDIGIQCDETADGWVCTCPEYPEIFPALQSRANVGETEFHWQKHLLSLRFLYGWKPDQKITALQFFGGLTPYDKSIEKLETYFTQQGYTLKPVTELSVHWEKKYPKQDRGSANFTIEGSQKEQVLFGFKIPHFRLLFDQYDSLPSVLQEAIFSRTKPCDNCGYCTQTNREQRSIMAKKKTFDGKTQLKCPLYPWFAGTDLPEDMTDILIQLYETAERLYAERK